MSHDVGITVCPLPTPESEKLLTPEALAFLGHLHRKFNPRRLELLHLRSVRAQKLAAGERPDFLKETAQIRAGKWQVGEAPARLQKRYVEITGPCAPTKMVINALNSGANCFKADFEDALAPTWAKLMEGQTNLYRAVRRDLEWMSPENKHYKLESTSNTLLIVRPRGWHMVERHVLVDGEPMSGSMFDWGLFFFHNAKEQLARGDGPFFYLPKMESHLEARLWNDIFCFAQDYVGLPRGTIKVTVLIETILAAFEMEEILFELRDHCVGLNAGRWDYIFSCIKKLRDDPKADFAMDRVQITMKVPFMSAYTNLLVKTCHKRGAHAMGGMSNFIPIPKDPAATEVAFNKVKDDKLLETKLGYDGTWVAHPGLVKIAQDVFEDGLKGANHQKHVMREDVNVTADDLLNFQVEGAKVTEAGLRKNIRTAAQYITAWLGGEGAVAIEYLMEDVATAEISRSQIWQWIRRGIKLDDGRVITKELYAKLRDEECATGCNPNALKILDSMILRKEYVDWLVYLAYDYLLMGKELL